MPIRYQCEHCGASMTIKDKLAGTKGRCPKCRKSFIVPEPSESAAAGGTDAVAAAVEEEELSEEDAIFGKDFFSMDQPQTRPQVMTLSNEEDDDSEDEPAPVRRPRPAAASAPPGDNAANIAGALLSKTGKKNRPSDFEEPDPDRVEYDFTELKYRLTHQLLPLLGILLVAVPLLYWMVDSMFGEDSLLPKLAPVSGTVTLDGKAVPAQLDFIPVVESNTPQSAMTGSAFAQAGDDGAYVAMYRPDVAGAIVGKNQVRIRTSGYTFNEVLDVPADGLTHNFELVSPDGRVDPRSAPGP